MLKHFFMCLVESLILFLNKTLFPFPLFFFFFSFLKYLEGINDREKGTS